MKVYVEGGGDGKDLRTRCRQGFRALFERCGFERQPGLVACGPRNRAFDDFRTALRSTGPGQHVALLVDSEEPVADFAKLWEHLQARDGWSRPAGATEEHVMVMATCMEAWIAADRVALRDYFGGRLQEGALPSVQSLEQTARGQLLDKLCHATRDCTAPYAKGRSSFDVLGKLDPATLRTHLASFRDAQEKLESTLGRSRS